MVGGTDQPRLEKAAAKEEQAASRDEWVEDIRRSSSNDETGREPVDGVVYQKDVKGSPALQLDTYEAVVASARELVKITGLSQHADFIERGALMQYFPSSIPNNPRYTPEEQKIVSEEVGHRWRQNKMLYLLAISGAVSAAVQGMDESTVGGAVLFYIGQFNIDTSTSYGSTLEGLINSIPYLGAAVIGCWAAIPSNYLIGRRWTIFWASLLAAASGLWQAFSPSWQMLLIGRLLMGISIGTKSATVYTAESVPASIRGGLVMLWQTFTAFGVAMGSVMGLAFLHAKYNWRLILGSTFVPPLFVCAMMFFLPESPRYLLQNQRYAEAFNAFDRLRRHRLLAGRDFYYTYEMLQFENKLQGDSTHLSRYWQMFSKSRNRSGAWAAWILMFGYYISTILTGAGFSNEAALAGSCGFGFMAFFGALTAIKIIDLRGRRWLLLTTFPLMVVFLLWIAFAFYSQAEQTLVPLTLTGIYLYVYFYGIGAGPVPFTYSAEAFPISLRSEGMAFSTATTWMFSFVLGFTLPNMLLSIGNTGVFCFYAGWCAVLGVLIFFFVPETKQYTLEELDLIFDIPILEHAKFQLRTAKRFLGAKHKKETLLSLALKNKEQKHHDDVELNNVALAH